MKIYILNNKYIIYDEHSRTGVKQKTVFGETETIDELRPFFDKYLDKHYPKNNSIQRQKKQQEFETLLIEKKWKKIDVKEKKTYVIKVSKDVYKMLSNFKYDYDFISYDKTIEEIILFSSKCQATLKKII